jgi:hypothetical protein
MVVSVTRPATARSFSVLFVGGKKYVEGCSVFDLLFQRSGRGRREPDFFLVRRFELWRNWRQVRSGGDDQIRGIGGPRAEQQES